MKQSTSGLHVAIVMDGNGRWATRRGLARTHGHRAGARAVRPIVETAPTLGVGALTLFAFSADNWRRPPGEVTALMRLFARHLRTETPRLVEHGVRLEVVGRRDRLPAPLAAAPVRRDDARELCRPMVPVRRHPGRRQRRARLVPPAPLIRTGGEQRLSDFLLWECAYAELYFTERMWPDFAPADLAAAIEEFRARERRFGTLPKRAAG